MTQRYDLQFRPAAAKTLRRLPRNVAKRIKEASETLRDDPRPREATALQGQKALLRIRVADYRVVYQIDDGALIVLVIHIGHRRDVYRAL